MKKEQYEALPEQSKRYVCTEHGVPKMETRLGAVRCPFCEKEEWEEDEA